MRRVIVVDDNPEGRHVLRAIFQSEGWDADEAADGAEALELARQALPDLVVTDLLMPVMDGFTLLRHWKADARTHAIPVVVFTATYTDAQDERLARALGADAFIVKPVEPERFMEEIRVILAAQTRGEFALPREAEGGEVVLLRQYNEVLIRRLEEKARTLEQTNRELATREAHLRAMFDSEPECVSVLARDGTLLEINPAGLRMFGADAHAQVEHHSIYALADEAHHDALRALVARGFREEPGTLEFQITGLTGDRRWVDMHAGPLKDATGAVTAVLGITRDITERHRAEAALRESEATFRAICEASPVGIFLMAPDGHVTYGNPADLRMTGLSYDETMGLKWMKAIHPDDRAAVMAEWEASVAAGRPYVGTGRYLHEDGTVVWWDVATAPVCDGERLLGSVGLVVDITERRRAAHTLEQANHRLQVLSRQLLHIEEAGRRALARELHDEIGQALTATKINLESLRRFPDPGAAASRLQDSVAIVDRALQQVRSLSLELRPALLDDLGLVAALRWLVDQQGRRGGLGLEFHCALRGERFGTATETACFRVAQEALTNIVRHAHASHVTLDLRRQGDELHLAVADDGAGFDAAAARRSAAQGTSLGLLSMEERAKLAGGGIEWQSTPGTGTHVHAWFAVHEPATPGAPATMP